MERGWNDKLLATKANNEVANQNTERHKENIITDDKLTASKISQGREHQLQDRSQKVGEQRIRGGGAARAQSYRDGGRGEASNSA